MINLENLKRIVKSFAHKKIGVVGDIVADRFIFGVPARLSREAPVVIIEYESEELYPGCGGNTIRNLQDLGATVYPVSLLGDDVWGQKILEHFQKGKVSTDFIFLVPDQRTVTKTRIMAGDYHTKKQQVVRIDRGKGVIPNREIQQKLLEAIDHLTDHVDGWIISDYDYPLISLEIRQKFELIGQKMPVVVDSRRRLLSFQKITLCTPNEEEAEKASGMKIHSYEDAYYAAEKLLKKTEAQAILITRGNLGMGLFQKDGTSEIIPCYGSLHIADVTGAGDTVTSVVGLALASGATYKEAAHLATYAASVVVMKMGTATCSQSELCQVLEEAFG